MTVSLRTGTVWQGEFARSGPSGFAGYVYDASRPNLSHVVELLVDGLSLAAGRADEFLRPLRDAGIGDGRRGFTIGLPVEVLVQARRVEAVVANLGVPVGKPIDLHPSPVAAPAWASIGAVEWVGGLQLRGWTTQPADNQVIRLLVDGDLLDIVRADGFRHVGSSADDVRIGRSFRAHLPERFADGRVHAVEMLTEAGLPLDGSPLAILAYPDGLAAALAGIDAIEAHRPRAALFDRLLPLSMPLEAYQDWRVRFPPKPAEAQASKAAVIFVGPGGPDPAIRTDAVACLALDHGTDLSWGEEGAATLCKFLTDGEADLVLLAPGGTRFEPGGWQRLAAAFADPSVRLAYADVDGWRPAAGPSGFGAFDYERCLEQGYAALLYAMPRASMLAALSAGATSSFALFLEALQQVGEGGAIAAVPGSVATLPAIDIGAIGKQLVTAAERHLTASGQPAAVTERPGGCWPSVHVRRQSPKGRTSVVVTVRHDVSGLQRTLESIEAGVRRAGASILVVDNTPGDSAAIRRAATGAGATVLPCPGDANLAALRNAGAAAARERILFLSAGLIAEGDDWLAELEGRLSGPAAAAAGPMEVTATGLVRQAGLVLDFSTGTAPALADQPISTPGFGNLLTVARDVSALFVDGLLVDRAAFLGVGGFDDRFLARHFHAADLCLKLRAKGRRLILTPHARLVGDGGPSGTGSSIGRDRELAEFRRRWGSWLSDDPAYSPVFAPGPVPYAALRWEWSSEPRLSASPFAMLPA